MITATRVYDFCYGHSVTGHHIEGKPGKCRHIHGHNGRIEWTISVPELDELGRVLDFGVMKQLLDEWVETHWDHKFLLWEQDPRASQLALADPEGIILLDFNPTAENLAHYLLRQVGSKVLKKTKAQLVAVRLWETRKCFVDVTL
jgi:6-pyruvoyltetrahydropterin/6-carboxytetrahydropterin synthase